MAEQRIGRYAILEEIASGTQGTVHRAFDPESGQIVALKVLHASLSGDRSYLERFHREATITSSIDHPNVVDIHEVGESGGRHFIAMEFLPESLGRLIESAGRLPIPSAVSFAAQIADGLAAAHARGVVHRDIKPQNVLIAADGTAKVTDFGIARGESLATMTATGMMMGTPYYMSPEQCLGERADARSDVYSLGCVLYQMLTGALPFEASTPLAVLRKHTDEPPRPIREVRDDIPQPVVDIVGRALAKEPERRFGQMSQMAEALRAAAPELAARSIPSSPLPPMPTAPETAPRPPPPPPPPPVAAVPPAPPIRGTGTVCADCGAPWRAGAGFCPRCGSPNFQRVDTRPTMSARPSSGGGLDRVRHLEYHPLRARATWARILLGICGVLLVASLFSTWAEIELLERMAAWQHVSDQEITDNDTRQSVIGILYLVALVGSAMAFCVWIYGASKNLYPLGVDHQRFSPRWAVGWWFVPFMCLFRPYQVMSEIWRGSDPDVPSGDFAALDHARNSALMGWWWASWLISGWVGWIFLRLWMSGSDTAEEWIAADRVSMVDDGLTFLAAVLAFLLVSQITRRQEEKHERLSYASP